MEYIDTELQTTINSMMCTVNYMCPVWLYMGPNRQRVWWLWQTVRCCGSSKTTLQALGPLSSGTSSPGRSVWMPVWQTLLVLVWISIETLATLTVGCILVRWRWGTLGWPLMSPMLCWWTGVPKVRSCYNSKFGLSLFCPVEIIASWDIVWISHVYVPLEIWMGIAFLNAIFIS